MRSCTLTVALILLAGCAEPEGEWYKGNLHTHTFWSDGDDFPEAVIQWYRDAGYHFLSISDHNVLAQGQRWMFVDSARTAVFEQYDELLGGQARTRRSGDSLFVRLATFEEYAAPHRGSGSGFLVIQAEEITDHFESRPLHLNATNVQRVIEPQGGTSVTDVLQRNIDAVLAQEEAEGVPMLPHVNHPNYGWAVTPDDLVPLEGEHFFEVYNGHPAVHNYGDEGRPGTEKMWDYVNRERLRRGGSLLLGLAVDDSHHYHEQRVGLANTGRGWVIVRAAELTPEALIEALKQGSFYASSGVSLSNVDATGSGISLQIEAQQGVSYETAFLGARKGSFELTEFARIAGPTPSYAFQGDELFVRASIVSTRPMDNPHVEGEVERAWTQPILVD